MLAARCSSSTSELDRARRRRAAPRSRAVRGRSRSAGMSPLPSSISTRCFRRLERGQQRREQAEQRAVDEDHLVVGVVDDVGELLGEQPDVERVQHAPRARGGEVQLEVAGGVPGERGDAARRRRCRGRRAPRRVGGCAPPTRRRWCVRSPAPVAVTIVLWAKYFSARSNRCGMASGTSCIRPCIGPKVVHPGAHRSTGPIPSGDRDRRGRDRIDRAGPTCGRRGRRSPSSRSSRS